MWIFDAQSALFLPPGLFKSWYFQQGPTKVYSDPDPGWPCSFQNGTLPAPAAKHKLLQRFFHILLYPVSFFI
jgi:hypothetical protein